MKMTHDREADAVYIQFTDRPYAYGKDLDNERRVDYDADDNPIGVELLYVSIGVITDGLPDKTEIERALDERGIKMSTMVVPYALNSYTVIVHEAEEGGYWGEVLELPGCVSQGETIDEFRNNIREALEVRDAEDSCC